MKTKPSALNDAERAIWTAAYGAAFAVEFSANLAACRGDWDRAEGMTSAEPAWQMADLAVEKYRQWRDEDLPAYGGEERP